MGKAKLVVVVAFLFVFCAEAATASGSSPLRVLLTNDDGWDSPAIQALKARLRADGHEVVLAAPSENRSGSGAALTFDSISVIEQGPGEFSIDGTPATCVKIGLAIMGDPPDLLISGPNLGFGGGWAGIHSGTSGAAFTGVVSGVPALAVASDPPNDPSDAALVAHFANVADFTARLVDRLARRNYGRGLLPRGIVLKVGYPPLDPADVAGVRIAEQGEAATFRIGYTEVAPGLFAPSTIPRDPAELDPRGEVALYREGNITLAPLDVDQTARVWVRKRVGFAVRGLEP